MKLNSLKTVAVTALFSVASAYAATPTIGVASAFGSFTVDSARVNGNSNLANGSQISTTKAPSQIFLQGGQAVTIATNSGATIYNDHLILSQGSVRVDSMDKYDVRASGIRVAAEEPGTQAAVRLREGTVEVASISGAVKVFDANGAMLTRVGAGTASSFNAGGGQTGAGEGNGNGNGNSRHSKSSNTGASGSVSGSNALLYTSILVGLAGVGVGTVALLDNPSSSPAQ